MVKKKKPQRKPKPEPYKDELARSALSTLVIYLVEAVGIALASFLLSFFKLNGFVDLAVVILFLRDIEDLPEKAPKTRVAIKSMIQGLVVFGLSLLFNDTFGEIASGLLILILGLFLFEKFGYWLDRKLRELDKWLRKVGLQ